MLRQVYRQFRRRVLCYEIEDSLVHAGGDLHREQTVLQSVVRENVGKRCADDCAKSKCRQGPRCVFARRSAPEVIARAENTRALVLGAMQHKIRPHRPVGIVPPVGEQVLPQSGLVGYFQEPGRDDLVRVDVVHRHRYRP